MRSRLSIPPLSTLRSFEAAARLKSFKAAAEDLGLTQSAISHQINSLEAHFHRKFFTRQGNKVVLTDDGETYGAVIRKAFADISRAGETLLSKNRKEVVWVSASPSFAAFAALPYIADFKTINSSLDLRLEARNNAVDFDTENIDAAILVGDPPYPGLSAHRLFKSQLIPLAHPALCDKFGPIDSPDDIARLPLIELNNIPGLWERWFKSVAPGFVLQELVLSSDSLLAAIQMAESGVGAVLAPFPLVGALIASGRLKALSDRALAIEKPDFYLVYRKSDVTSVKIKAIRQWLKNVVLDLESKMTRPDPVGLADNGNSLALLPTRTAKLNLRTSGAG
jgi:LysR family glycine cleavage system transcriptional activator